jgi:hypothetical protein
MRLCTARLLTNVGRKAMNINSSKMTPTNVTAAIFRIRFIVMLRLVVGIGNF